MTAWRCLLAELSDAVWKSREVGAVFARVVTAALFAPVFFGGYVLLPDPVRTNAPVALAERRALSEGLLARY